MPIADSVKLGKDVKIFHPSLVNLYGCTIGSDSKIGAFVEIQKNATIGERCKISSHTFICEGVTIEDEVFVGHGVMFTNDRLPARGESGWLAADRSGLESRERRSSRRGASIGSNATIVAGITIGVYALIGAGAVVTKDVPPLRNRGGSAGQGHRRHAEAIASHSRSAASGHNSAVSGKARGIDQ